MRELSSGVRANARQRKALLTGLANLLSRAIMLGTSLVSVPLTLGYLETERYGLWLTISSLVAMLSFADLGVGNGLLNSVSRANGLDDVAMARRYISSAVVLLTLVGLALLVATSVVVTAVDLDQLLNIQSSAARAEAAPALAIFMVCFALGLPIGIAGRVQAGYQAGYLNSIWVAAGNLGGLLGVLIAIRFRAGLPVLVAAIAGVPLVFAAVNAVFLFGVQRLDLRPRWRDASKSKATELLKAGALFLVLQTAVAFAFSSDSLVIAHLFGQKAVVEYGVQAKLFALVPALVGMFVAPLWPAYGEALARGDVQWVRAVLLRSLMLSCALTSICSVPLVLMAPMLVKAWTGHRLAPELFLAAGLGFWMVLSTVGNALAMFMNAANVIRPQAITAIALAVGALILKIVFANWVGLPGIVWGTIVAYVLTTALPYAFLVPRLLRSIAAGADSRITATHASP